MSSTSLDYPVSSLQENPQPNSPVLTPKRGGHDIPSAVRLPDHRWRHDLALGLEVQVRKSAHPSTATRHRACHVVGPIAPIRYVRAMNTATTTPAAIRPSATDGAAATVATTNRIRQANWVSGNMPTTFAIPSQTARTSCHGIVQNSTATSYLVWPKRIRPTAAAITTAAWAAGSLLNCQAC